MAKRKRLTPARTGYLATPPASSGNGVRPGLLASGSSPAPIASVAGEASAASALSELSESLERARSEGRMVVSLPLTQVETGYLVRDRIAVADEETEALKESLRARGQQTPVEVTTLGPDRYGLISGWRRVTAIKALHEETGEERFEAVQALIRKPSEASEAYTAMVEENEIRVGLSYYERARIVVKAAEAGVFPDASTALARLFGAASRSRRSKIKSYLAIVRTLDGQLRFPQAIGERLGLQLSRALEDPGFAERAGQRLSEAAPGSAEEETALLTALLAPSPAPSKASEAPAPQRPRIAPGETCTLTRDVRLRVDRDGSVTLYGPGVTDSFRSRLLEAFGSAGAE
ncbi:ParB/RepB/Spo0J family partition protein [Histidinibacterium aquaticum]|uniref:Nuclease n=1 Tax=Histidinibacterium aquaticum TaxID=2613962 RepID=A0A5J5GAE0_9RHOB|nr:ParB N-terminal domain-containing protein [Histidinibacterium aquaticum]KAA9005096.1 nuclease [Histidinibacterium aquaticum]